MHSKAATQVTQTIYDDLSADAVYHTVEAD